MAFNWPVFKTRALSAMVFVAVMLAGLMTSPWLFLLLFSVIHWGCWKEYQELMGKIQPAYREISPFHRYGVIIAGWCMILFASSDQWKIGTVSISAIGFWIGLILIFVLPMIEILFSKSMDLKNIRISALGLLYISLSCTLIVHLRSGRPWMGDIDSPLLQPINSTTARYTGFLVPLIIIASICINDTMAYIVGSLIGKTPLSSISPKKTWEGTIGGILLSVTFVTLYAAFVIKSSWQDYLAISSISAIAGTFGDLLESKFKRMAGVKDSGMLMPGHGGFLDRFDSMLVAIPFVWLYAVAFM
jgi:phosphatidate cytidylyltransferase